MESTFSIFIWFYFKMKLKMLKKIILSMGMGGWYWEAVLGTEQRPWCQ